MDFFKDGTRYLRIAKCCLSSCNAAMNVENRNEAGRDIKITVNHKKTKNYCILEIVI